MNFWQWEDRFPADPSVHDTKFRNECQQFIGRVRVMATCSLHNDDVRNYARPGALRFGGAIELRPWHLNFHKDLGLRGYLEPAQPSAVVMFSRFRLVTAPL